MNHTLAGAIGAWLDSTEPSRQPFVRRFSTKAGRTSKSKALGISVERRTRARVARLAEPRAA